MRCCVSWIFTLFQSLDTVNPASFSLRHMSANSSSAHHCKWAPPVNSGASLAHEHNKLSGFLRATLRFAMLINALGIQ